MAKKNGKLDTSHPTLAAEWDYMRNGALGPKDVSQGCEKEVWWRCPQGHSYRARVFARVAGTGCPYCTGKKVLAGFNDLATTDPDVATEWYAPLNGSASPEDVNRGSHKKYWWRCKEGHVWQAAVYTRTRKRAAGCPYCAGRLSVATFALPKSAR